MDVALKPNILVFSDITELSQSCVRRLASFTRSFIVFLHGDEEITPFRESNIQTFRIPRSNIKSFFAGLLTQYAFQSVIILPGKQGYPKQIKSLLECLEDIPPAKVIFGSSYQVYGNALSVPFSPIDRKLFPETTLGKSALSLEKRIQIMGGRCHFSVDVLRFFSLYGRENNEQNSMISRFADQLMKGEKIILNHAGRDIYDFIFLDDAVNAILLSSEQIGEQCIRIFNIASGKPTSLLELLMVLKNTLFMYHLLPNQCSLENIVECSKDFSGDIFIGYGDIRQSESSLLWHPLSILEEGLQKYARHLGRQ